jgi:mono/diheme cytochrome c family protein
MRTSAILALVIGATIPFHALAHGDMAAAYGGQIVEAGGDWRVEFIVRDGGIRAWVRDHADKPVAASGKAALLVNGRRIEVPLSGGSDGLSADIPVAAADKVAAILSLTIAGKPVSIRFSQEALTVPSLSPQALAGQQVFGQVCATCHGTALRGSDAGPPLLHPFYAAGMGHGDDIILAAATKGAKAHHWKFGDMPKPDGIAPGQEKDLLAYIRAMQAANGLGGAPAPAQSGHAGHAGH